MCCCLIPAVTISCIWYQTASDFIGNIWKIRSKFLKRRRKAFRKYLENMGPVKYSATDSSYQEKLNNFSILVRLMPPAF